jgi:pimeloyl-ACP methyl ester carboxylesterase
MFFDLGRIFMRKLLWIIAMGVGLIWMGSILLFISTDLQTLEPEEQQKLKEGKLFWEWSSPYGPLAIHYIEKGEGTKHVLLLHGFRAHTYTWRHLIDPLAKAGYHVWAIDLIGYGLSDKPNNATYHIDFFVQQVDAFMEAKGISKAHLIGNSMGGGLALLIALDRPHRAKSLTLISALGYPLDMPLYLSLGKHISQIWAPFLGPRMVRRCLYDIVCNKELVSDEQVEAYCLPYRFPGGITASLLTLRQFDNQYLIEMGKRYSTLLYPMLIIWGDYDWLIPVSHYEKFLNDFPNAKRLLIRDCGHIPQEEAPEQVLAAILEFLQEIDGVRRQEP